jgi:hypothetical protein
MFQTDILFSLVLSVVNTIAFYLLSNRKQSKDKKEQAMEYVMMFGITFVCSFLIKTSIGFIESPTEVVSEISNSSKLSHSSRPPF